MLNNSKGAALNARPLLSFRLPNVERMTLYDVNTDLLGQYGLCTVNLDGSVTIVFDRPMDTLFSVEIPTRKAEMPGQPEPTKRTEPRPQALSQIDPLDVIDAALDQFFPRRKDEPWLSGKMLELQPDVDRVIDMIRVASTKDLGSPIGYIMAALKKQQSERPDDRRRDEDDVYQPSAREQKAYAAARSGRFQPKQYDLDSLGDLDDDDNAVI